LFKQSMSQRSAEPAAFRSAPAARDMGKIRGAANIVFDSRDADCAGALVVCRDSVVARSFIAELAAAGGPHQTRLADTLTQAISMLERWNPDVIFLDESAWETVEAAVKTEEAVASLAEHAPVVVAAPARHQELLAFLICSGAVDLVVRVGNFPPVAAGLAALRARLAARVPRRHFAGPIVEEDFGEILRHEVNNPLTGILGNAELLLKRRSQLPSFAVERLETITELAVRLRETIRRLSDDLESRQNAARAV